VIPALLSFLAVLDAAFVGFRSAAGRDGRIDKRLLYLRAVGHGALAGAGLVAALAALTAVVLATAPSAAATYADLLIIGERMLHVIGVYTLLVLVALALYASPNLDVRVLSTVAVLGPFTILRPWIVVAATSWGLAAGAGARAAALTVTSSAAVLLLARAIDGAHARAARRRDEEAPEPTSAAA
jgi:hypothetical protein